MKKLAYLLMAICLVGCVTTKTYQSQNDEVDFGGGWFKGGLKFKITESRWANDYDNKKPQHRHLVVKTAITNPQNEPLALVGHTLAFRAVNAQGTEYAPTSTRGQFGIEENINPGMTANGELIFDVPDSRYSLKTSVFQIYGREERESFIIPLDPRQSQ